MAESGKPRVVGFNHVALEVGDIEEALAFYGRLFAFELRGKSDTMAFIDLGDQFIALQKGRKQAPDDGRHFGLVVDDKEAARRALQAAGVVLLDGPFLDFLDPWGNRIEIVGYDNIQFTKAPNVLRGMGLDASGQEREREEGAGRRRAWRSVRGRPASAAARPIVGGRSLARIAEASRGRRARKLHLWVLWRPLIRGGRGGTPRVTRKIPCDFNAGKAQTPPNGAYLFRPPSFQSNA